MLQSSTYLFIINSNLIIKSTKDISILNEDFSAWVLNLTHNFFLLLLSVLCVVQLIYLFVSVKLKVLTLTLTIMEQRDS